jgi:type II secretory pathway component GspD/PulD (secretin)
LAGALQRHFSGNAEIRAIAEPVSNTLLISMRPGQQDEVLAVLAELDRAPGMVTIEAMIVERIEQVVAGGEKKDTPDPINADEFTGPLAQVREKLAALLKGDRGVRMRTLRLTTLNNQLAQVQFGDDSASSGGSRNSGARGDFAQAPVRRPAGGFIFSATPRISKGDIVTLEAAIHDRSQAVQTVSDRGDAAGEGTGNPFEPSHSSALTTVSIRSGHAVVVGGMSTASESVRSQYFVIVAASVLKSDTPN